MRLKLINKRRGTIKKASGSYLLLKSIWFVFCFLPNGLKIFPRYLDIFPKYLEIVIKVSWNFSKPIWKCFHSILIFFVQKHLDFASVWKKPKVLCVNVSKSILILFSGCYANLNYIFCRCKYVQNMIDIYL